ncbi:hypothetical protein BLX24_08605 [Arsenicibacter rosenii]|uniref:Uncharacterized protein n=2 Tax=Arsenicibacter rosenii TaxID=1750698 RepID=A0A1S2VNZ2_9BACT|nr:hypothetical protein BLX24_08605 [Arsenicibacter rosenii]
MKRTGYLFTYLLLLTVAGIVVLFLMPLSAHPFPNLLPAIKPLGFFLPLLASLVLYPVFITVSVTVSGDDLLIRKGFGQRTRIRFDDILGYNEQAAGSKWAPEKKQLTIYTQTEWFSILETHFTGYADLKERLTQYGKPVPFRQGLNRGETRLLRGFVLGYVAFIAGLVWLGYAAYTPATPSHKTHRLQATIDEVRIIKSGKGRPLGAAFRLNEYPQFSFRATKKEFGDEVLSLPDQLRTGQTVQLTIMEQDFARKLTGTDALSFGDKFDDFTQINVFRIEAAINDSRLALTANTPPHADTHTRPVLWVLGAVAGLLIAWTCWVWIDRHQMRQILLRINQSASGN